MKCKFCASDGPLCDCQDFFAKLQGVLKTGPARAAAWLAVLKSMSPFESQEETCKQLFGQVVTAINSFGFELKIAGVTVDPNTPVEMTGRKLPDKPVPPEAS